MGIARARLVREVLGIDAVLGPAGGLGREGISGSESDAPGRWAPFTRFEPGGRCVATIEAAALPLVLDGSETRAAGIRSVAVHPDWRGHGLFRELMIEALAWCDSRNAGPTLLYSETPALYERFGFRTMPQHAFAGPPPSFHPGRNARRLDLGHRRDRSIIERIIARQTPPSSQCALGVDAALWMANVARDDALTIIYMAQPEALIVFEADAQNLIVADVVATVMPGLAAVVGAIGLSRPTVKTLFAPDKLDWRGDPVPEETGLMIRGPIPSAMTRPFMFPPTVEF